MKLSGVKGTSYLKGQSPSAATLIFSENTARARQSLQKFTKNILGADAQNEMRSETLDAKEIQKDPAKLNDAMRSVSFFSGSKGVLIFDATDANCAGILDALSDRREGDAYLFIQAGNLKPASKLRKNLEPHPDVAVIGLYDDPLRPEEVQELCKQHRINLSKDALGALQVFASTYDRMAFENLLQTLSLYQGDAPELSLLDLQLFLPSQSSAAEDEIINAMFRGDAKTLVVELKRASAQGITMARLSMLAIWRARALFEILSSGNPMQALQTARPPLFGPRKQAMEDNIRRWKLSNLNLALSTLLDAEKEMRSGKSNLPERAYLERIFLRIAMLSR